MSIRALLVALVLTTTPPAVAENVLRWASAADALTFDPHAVSHQPTLVENLQVYEPFGAPVLDLLPDPLLGQPHHLDAAVQRLDA
jgi:hypothetical protein